MDLELITIGTELLLGFTVDTNSAEIARTLASVGVRVMRTSTVADDPEDIRNAVMEALSRTRFAITTGGLGPTRDDVTKRVVAEIFSAPLELDSEYLESLRRRFEELGIVPMPESNRSQAEIPRGATALPNRWGTAPGIWLEGEPGSVVMLPGVPREMRGLLTDEVLPRLRERLMQAEGGVTVTVSRLLRTTGIAESALTAEIGDVESKIAPVTLAYLPGIEGVDLRLTAWRLAPDEANALLDRAVDVLRPPLGTHYYGEGDRDLAEVTLESLKGRGYSLAVAESCTGGLLGQRVTSVPGSSEVFRGGTVAYADDAKIQELEVPERLITDHGAVSEEVARAMALGATRKFRASASVAVTGIAGPGGGTDEKPVGTVWIAAKVGENEKAICYRFPGDREAVRCRSAQAALDLLRRLATR